MFSAAIANTRGMNSPRTPLSDTDRTLVDAWLDNQWLERGLSRHTLESYGRDLRQFGEWLAGGGRNLGGCDRERLLSFLADRHRQGVGARSVARTDPTPTPTSGDGHPPAASSRCDANRATSPRDGAASSRPRTSSATPSSSASRARS